jgi:hypothetical protein
MRGEVRQVTLFPVASTIAVCEERTPACCAGIDETKLYTVAEQQAEVKRA